MRLFLIETVEQPVIGFEKTTRSAIVCAKHLVNGCTVFRKVLVSAIDAGIMCDVCAELEKL